MKELLEHFLWISFAGIVGFCVGTLVFAMVYEITKKPNQDEKP